MRAGRLRQRVTIQQKDSPVSQNDYGEETPTWEKVATVWGSVEPLRGREFLEAMREGAEVTTRIVIRHREGIAPEMRAVVGSHTYDIVSAIEVEMRGREMQLMCREVL